MSSTPSAVGSRSTMLPIALIALAATSLVHHAHNAEFLDEYPNMPGWLSAAAVYGAWLVAALVGVLGYVLLRTGYQGTGALLHYVIAPLSAHSAAMHFTIGLEAAAGVFLLGVIARRFHG
jgi:hypothetical protein